MHYSCRWPPLFWPSQSPPCKEADMQQLRTSPAQPVRPSVLRSERQHPNSPPYLTVYRRGDVVRDVSLRASKSTILRYDRTAAY